MRSGKKGTAGPNVWQRIHEVLARMDAQGGTEVELAEKALREKWHRRAVELARPAKEGDEEIHLKVILLRVGKESYCFLVDDVEEILRVPPITPVPCVPPHFIGVVNRRGGILALVDLKVFFGGEPGQVTGESRVVVLTRNRMSLGLLVESADKIINLPSGMIAPPLRRGDGMHEEFCSGVITLGKKVVVLIDSLRLLQDQRLRVDKGV